MHAKPLPLCACGHTPSYGHLINQNLGAKPRHYLHCKCGKKTNSYINVCDARRAWRKEASKL